MAWFWGKSKNPDTAVLKKRPAKQEPTLSTLQVGAALEHAEAFMDIEDYPKAIMCFDAYLADFPDHATSYVNRCICYTALDACDSAVADARKAMSLRKALSPISYTNLAKILHNDERFLEALEYCELALSRDSDYSKAVEILPMIHSKIGIVYEKQGDLIRALYHAKEALRFAPSKEDYRHNVAHLQVEIASPRRLAQTQFENDSQRATVFDQPCLCEWCGQTYEYHSSRAHKKGLYCRPKCEEESKEKRGH